MDLSDKLGWGIVFGIILILLSVVYGVQTTNKKFIEEGYSQERITYCSSNSISTVWVKK